MTATDRDAEAHADLAQRMADAAAAIIRRHFRAPLAVDDKADDSPVTIADREAETAMRDLLAREAPGHGILGEEHGARRTDAEWVWVLDPIDGTKAFVTGKPSFGTLIALLRHGRPVLGLIDQCITGERWLGVAGRPSTLNGNIIRVRPCDTLDKAYAYTTGPELFAGRDARAWERIAAAVKQARYGADCYAYALLATGCVDLVVEAGLKPYDYCALVPVIEGAGGVITDWDGHPLGLHSDGRVCASGDPRLHARALEVLNRE